MLPRQVLPRRFYLITRRCTQRQLLLRPDPATNNAFLYCLIAAATRCQIDVLLACALSNHYHLVIYDRAGRYPEFIEHFHKLVARSQNALRGRWENFWAAEQTCVVNLVDRNAVIDKLVYTATNPVLAHLVERVHHWPGVNSLTALLASRQLADARARWRDGHPPHFRPAPTGSSGLPRCRSSRHDLVQPVDNHEPQSRTSIPAQIAPRMPDHAAHQPVAHDVLVDRDRRPLVRDAW